MHFRGSYNLFLCIEQLLDASFVPFTYYYLCDDPFITLRMLHDDTILNSIHGKESGDRPRTYLNSQ